MNKIRINSEPQLTVSVIWNNEEVAGTSLSLSETPGFWLEGVDESTLHGAEFVRWMEEYAGGQQPSCLLPLAQPKLTPFTQQVINAISLLPFGQSTQYQSLAASIGNLHASRAVGSACGRNPFPLIVPCHRVLAAKQQLGGFALDSEIKRRLLRFEKISFC